jgi:hypothetical protein
MEVILAIVVFILALAFESLADYLFGLVFFRSHRFSSKLMVAFLVGFIVFILVTPNVPGVEQRVTVVIVCILLIYANLFLGKKKEDEEDNLQ